MSKALLLLQRAAQAAFLYNVRVPVRLALRALCDARAEGWERIPLHGGLIVAANHTSFCDPIILQAYTPRHLTYLMIDRYYRARAVAWFCRFWGAIPVREAGLNVKPVRRASDLLRAGRAIGIFPEGRISRDGLIHDAEPGVALLARRAGVPIVPVGMDGVQRFLPPDTWAFSRSRMTMVVGEPIRPEGRSRNELAAEIMDQIRTCARRARERSETGD